MALVPCRLGYLGYLSYDGVLLRGRDVETPIPGCNHRRGAVVTILVGTHCRCRGGDSGGRGLDGAPHDVVVPPAAIIVPVLMVPFIGSSLLFVLVGNTVAMLLVALVVALIVAHRECKWEK